MITVKTVSSRKEKKDFCALTDHLYTHSPYYVPTLKIELKDAMKQKHPFYEHGEAQFFIAYKDGQPAGRICVYQNHQHNQYHKDTVGFFGSFECVDDQEVAKTLLEVAQQWLAKRGLTMMRGPIDYYSNEPQGLLIDGFDSMPPASLPYHLPYYRQLLEHYGFQKQADLYAYCVKDFNSLPFDRGDKLVERVTQRNEIHLRPLNLKDLDNEVKKVVKLFNIFESVNGQNFIPITEKEAHNFIKTIKPIIKPELVYFAEKDNRVIGFVATIPDVNELLIKIKHGRLLPTGIFKLLRLKNTKYTRIRVILLGMLDEFKKTGLGPALAHKTLSYARQHHYKSMDMSMIHEDNQLMRNMCENLGGKIYKSYRVYEMETIS